MAFGLRLPSSFISGWWFLAASLATAWRPFPTAQQRLTLTNWQPAPTSKLQTANPPS
jgi:hypothetical protein